MKDVFATSQLTAQEFLRDYWQRQPLLLPQAFPDFVPELDPNDVAGLACDDLAESRLVTGSYPAHDWSLRYGPFAEEELTRLPETDWTLLVQDVEKHWPRLGSLLAAFDFLPRWRIDDLMVSVAGPGGSVGPHVDQYDVFLLQAAGARRWRIARDFDPALQPDSELNVLRSFEAETEWLLQPGDMLYLPPRVAHHGIAEGGLSMTWSIGMRAPDAADLLQALGEWLAESQEGGPRYRDPGLAPASRPGEIDRDAVGRVRALLQSSLADRDSAEPGLTDPLAAFLGAFLSRYRLAHEPAAPDTAWTATRLRRALQRGARLHAHPWTRLPWVEADGSALLFAGGAGFRCSIGLAQSLSAWNGFQPDLETLTQTDLEALTELLGLGHLLLEPL
jgi:50S ribosomal protein L16 3-hydroxylase